MQRIFLPALMAVAMAAFCTADASAFGLLDKICGKSGDACCDVGPTCGCEVAPSYGYGMADPTCGCEVAPSCGCDNGCDSGCGCGIKKGLLHKLFHKHNACDAGCASAPTCGCEVMEPACGCEIVDPCGCDSPCRGPSCGQKIKGFFGKIFHKHNACDACCDMGPTCGCETVAPSYGCEPSCGCGF